MRTPETGNSISRIATFCRALACALVLSTACGCENSTPPGGAPIAGAAPFVDPFQIALGGSDSARRIEVTGFTQAELAALSKEAADAPLWESLIELRVAGVPSEATPPVAGKTRLDGDTLTFTPQFPLRAGMTYVVNFYAERIPGREATKPQFIYQEFTLPAPRPAPPANVVAVFPSQNELPENLLKFYIEFSAPMSRGEAYERIQLLDAAGTAIELPFLELDEELWNDDGTRFTLLFDPGRIKQELKPKADVGSPLRAGQKFALVISAEWRDATGAPLEKPFRREFAVGPRDETQPNVDRWQVTPPARNSRDALEVAFDEPLDRGMLQRVLNVVNDNGELIDGAVEVTDSETRWRFVPANTWSSGKYAIVALSTLEDRAGNSLARPFEVDLTRPQPLTDAPASFRVPFEVR